MANYSSKGPVYVRMVGEVVGHYDCPTVVPVYYLDAFYKTISMYTYSTPYRSRLQQYSRRLLRMKNV